MNSTAASRQTRAFDLDDERKRCRLNYLDPMGNEIFNRSVDVFSARTKAGQGARDLSRRNDDTTDPG